MGLPCESESVRMTRRSVLSKIDGAERGGGRGFEVEGHTWEFTSCLAPSVTSHFPDAIQVELTERPLPPALVPKLDKMPVTFS